MEQPYYPADNIDSGPPGGANYSGAFGDDHEAWDYVADQYTLPNEVQMAMFFLYGVNIFISVTGNIVVICVFTYGRKSRTELAPFLINLAVSDLIMAVFCMPFTSTQILLSKWIYPHFLCPAVSFMQHISVSSSIYTQTFISIDRLRSICRPFRTRVSKTAKELLIILGFIWFWSLFQASVQFFISKVQWSYFENSTGTDIYLCLETWPSPVPNDNDTMEGITHSQAGDYSQVYTVCVFSIDYVIPLLCIGCAYSYVGRKLWERTTPGEASDTRDRVQLQSKRKVIKMLALMVLSFGILWLPLQTFFLLHDFSSVLRELPPKYYHTLFVTCHYVAMLSVIVNIVIYVLVNKNFKSDLSWFLEHSCWKRFPHSEVHRQAVALRRAPAMHHYHRGMGLGIGKWENYSKENSQSSPMHPYGRPLSGKHDAQFRSSKNLCYNNGSPHFLLLGANGQAYSASSRNGGTPRSPRSLPNMKSNRKNFLEYSSYSDV